MMRLQGVPRPLRRIWFPLCRSRYSWRFHAS